jgi:serine/threonine protein kinase/formylglycine-generating enzyme required for sulfatase activity
MSASSRHQRLFELFERALASSPEERTAFLKGLSGADQALADEVQALLRADAASAPPLPPLTSEAGAGVPPAEEVLERLSSRRSSAPRYRIVGEIGRGGMGAILRVWDEDLRRVLAMKVTLGHATTGVHGASPPTPPVDARTLGRFLEEAQITGQLDHPGIVPVHELGVDGEGRVFFTMRLVKGSDLRRVFGLVRANQEGWTLTRALGVLLKICEALAYAHSRGVIHRDLKPANIMVGRFGETYVMDWGLGRVLDRADTRNLRIRSDPVTLVGLTPRTSPAQAALEPLYTQDGDIVGTPAYMPPEQAAGEIERMDQRSDVYSVGALLYELLAGHAPYDEPSGPSGARLGPREILERVRHGPPRPLRACAPNAPAELVAIAERAMQRHLAARYGGVGELAEDLHAFLEGRVVRAYRTGPVVEFRKWVLRNRAFATAAAALAAVLVIGGFSLAALEHSRRRSAERHTAERSAAALAAELDELWPIHPASIPKLEAWLASASPLAPWRERVREDLEALERENAGAAREADPLARAPDPGVLRNLRARHDGFQRLVGEKKKEAAGEATSERRAFLAYEIEVLEGELPILAARLAEEERRLAVYRPQRYASPTLEARHAGLRAFVQDLQRVFEHIPDVEARLATLRSLEPLRADRAWEAALAAIADRARSPRYAGLELAPQIGLLPLGQDPASGLFEFWHVASGARPEGEPGAYRLRAETGIVLVLIPGGEAWIGAQASDLSAPNYVDPKAPGADQPGALPRTNEQPVRAVRLDPYFLSKYELTQGQWLRMGGGSPSAHAAGSSYKNATIPAGSERFARTHPVEGIDWESARRWLERFDLALPTEAQWEHGARAGSTAAFFWGSDAARHPAGINFADLSFRARQPLLSAETTVNDGWSAHAPVDRGPANAFGLHHVSGNVAEWCLDWTDGTQLAPCTPGTGEQAPDLGSKKSLRGGSYGSTPAELRVALRVPALPSYASEDTGVRPARAIDPKP